MLNPYFWLAIVIMLALSGFTGYRQGVKVTKAEYEEAAKTAMEALIARHNEIAAADIKAAIKAEKDRQKRRIRNMEVQHELELEAARNHRPDCNWTDRERWLLNDIIDRANGKEDATGSMPDGLRRPAETDGSNGQGGKNMGWTGRIKLWRMSLEAR